jgi:hypothetical protein
MAKRKDCSSSESSQESDSDSDEEIPAVRTPKLKSTIIIDSDDDSPLEDPPLAMVKDGQAIIPKSSPSGSPSANSPIGKPQLRNRWQKKLGKITPAKGTRQQRQRFITLSSDEDEMILSQLGASLAKQKTPPSTRTKRKHELANDEPLASNPMKRQSSESSEIEDDEPILSSPRKRRRVVILDNKSQSDSDLKVTKRLTRQQQNTPRKPHRTMKQKQMEILKRKRAGEKIESVDQLTDSGSESEGPKAGVYDTDSDLAVLSQFEDEESEEAIEVQKSVLSEAQEDDEDDFVVEDDDAPLGVPGHSLVEIPLEFTHQAHKPLKDHFKDAVEWMVQKKINPGFNGQDPIYQQAFRKLNDEVRGYAHSKFSSAAWSEAFTRAVWARPTFYETELHGIETIEGRKCDACNRSGHPAKFQLQFGGKAYSQDTLEEIDNGDSDDEDGSGEDDTKSVNSRGQPIPPEDTVFYVGRFCKANAETAHALIHWKHALNGWVEDQLENEGYLAPEALAERIKWKKKRLGQFANGIVDKWGDEGQIKALYRDFKNNLDSAREQKQDRWRTS